MRVKSNGKKPLLMIAALALVVALSIGLTSAFLTSQQGLTNTFTPGKVSCEVVENVSDGKKTVVQVKNPQTDDAVPAYIRVAVVANTVDENGNITGSADVSGSLGGEGWVRGADGYYYYAKIVEPKEPNNVTDNLLSGEIDLDGIQVTVLAQAIQAHGVTGDLMAAEDAWKVNPTTGASVDAQ